MTIYVYNPIGLRNSGAVDIEAKGINNIGQIVGIYYTEQTKNGFVYDIKTDTYTVVNNVTDISDINDKSNFTWAVGTGSQSTWYAYGAAVIKPAHIYGATALNFVTGINNSGQIVGNLLEGYQFNWEGNSFLFPYSPWYGAVILPDNGAQAVTLRDPYAYDFWGHGDNVSIWTYAEKNNNLGDLVGYYYGYNPSNRSTGEFGFKRSSNDDWTTLSVPGSTSTEAYGINDSGQIVGRYTTGADFDHRVNHGFLYSNGAYYTIDVFGATSTWLRDISNDGKIIAQYQANGTNLTYSAVFTPQANPSALTGTTEFAIINRPVDGRYDIVDMGPNGILYDGGTLQSQEYSLGAVGSDWKFTGTGNFGGPAGTDWMLRNVNTGGLEVYNISNNNIVSASFMGTVGLDWQLAGFGNFDQTGGTDMMLQNTKSGGLEVYDIANNKITNAAFIGTVGLDWKSTGTGNFGSQGEDDFMLRNSNTGGLEIYNINQNHIVGAAFAGTVGLDWKASGFGNFSGNPGETDMLLRNVNTGGLEVYDIANNAITGAAYLGVIGLDWQFAGTTGNNLLLRNATSGEIEDYQINHNQITGAKSLGTIDPSWNISAIEASSGAVASGAGGSISDPAVSLITQAIASFDGSGDAIISSPISGDAMQQQQMFLTTPNH
jgi:probable HAF family extracellular repeat protein